MQSDDLVTENVVSRGNISWDGDRPGVVVGDQGIRCPASRYGSVIEKSNSIDLEELQSSLVGRGAVTIAVCEVINDWTVVRFWPGSPLHLNSSTSCDSR